MNKIKMILVTAIAILSFTSANTQTTKKASKAKKETVAMHYQCPMKCEGEKTYAKAGKCPVCQMDLKKVEAKKVNDGHEGHNHN